MENQSDHPAYGMADQASRTVRQKLADSSSSSSTAVIQVAALPSITDYGNIDPADDGYSWRMCGQNSTIDQGGRGSTIILQYQCAQAHCLVQKSVVRSVDGQIIELPVYRGIHNHLQRSVRWLGDGSERLEPISDDRVLLEASDAAGAPAGPSEPRTGNGGDEDDNGDVGIDGDAAAGDADASNRLRSKVWEDFQPVYMSGKLESAICKHCKNTLRAKTKNGNNHLHRHIRSCPAKRETSRVQQKCPTSQNDLPVSQNSKYGQENPLEEFIRSISDLCPISAVYSASYALFLAGRNPALNMVQQATVEEKFLSVFHNEKLKLKEKITATPGGVFLSLGEWLWDLYFEGLIVCLTVHFIDEDWKINRKTIRCALLEYCGDLDKYPHCQLKIGGENFEMVLKEVVRDWGLREKLLGATIVDEETKSYLENDHTAERNYLLAKDKLLTIPCMVNALHALMDSTVWNMKSTWSDYMTNSPERKQKYQEVLSQLHLDRPSFGSKDWYFTFYWSEAALQFVKSFPLPDAGLNQSGPPKPSSDDLEAIENFCRIARPIYHAIKAISDPCNVTFNSYFHVIWSLRATLQELRSMKNIERVSKVENMQRYFDENWNRWYLWLSIAVVLDPRHKLRFIELRFRQAFSQDARMYLSQVRAKLYELYIQYFFVNERRNGILNQSNNGSDTEINAPIHNQSRSYNTVQDALEEFKELSEYLGGELCPQNDSFDILKWWKGNSSAYPTLAKMARDILAIPGCAVSAESAFDRWDRRADLFNGKLRPETAEALICAQDWIKSSGTADADDGNNNSPF